MKRLKKHFAEGCFQNAFLKLKTEITTEIKIYQITRQEHATQQQPCPDSARYSLTRLHSHKLDSKCPWNTMKYNTTPKTDNKKAGKIEEYKLYDIKAKEKRKGV